jgi:hypothetical protein
LVVGARHLASKSYSGFSHFCPNATPSKISKLFNFYSIGSNLTVFLPIVGLPAIGKSFTQFKYMVWVIETGYETLLDRA